MSIYETAVVRQGDMHVSCNDKGRHKPVTDTMSASQRDELVRQALEKILESPGFSAAPKLSNFLDYVVRKTLDGKAHELKGYTIGVDALGRREDFDPQTDTTVRVMAGRLRRALNEYNHDLGENQPAQISIPKGSYVPCFSFLGEAANKQIDADIETTNDSVDTVPAAPGEARQIKQSIPSIYLLVFAGLLLAAVAIGFWAGYFESREQKSSPQTAANLESSQLPSISVSVRASEDAMPAWFSLREAEVGTIAAFSRFKEFRIYLVDYSTQSIGANDSLADYHFSSNLGSSGTSQRLRVTVTLTRQSDGVILWSDDILLDERDPAVGIDAHDIAGKTIAPLLSPYGIIYGNIASRKNAPAEMKCISLIYSYFLAEGSKKYAKARNCVEAVTRSGATTSSMHAVLALFYIHNYHKNIRDVGESPLAMADKAADAALELNPQNARAHQAAFAVHKARGHEQKALTSAAKAMALNPFDSSIIAHLAAYLVALGKLDDAEPLLKRSFELSDAQPVWLELFAYLHADFRGNFEQADQIAEGLSPPTSPMAALAVLLSAMRNGDTKNIEFALNVIQRRDADFLNDPKTALMRRGYNAETAERIAVRFDAIGTATRHKTLHLASQIPSGPRVAILPIEQLSTSSILNEFSRGFVVQLGHDLARFKDLYLLSTHSSLAMDERSLREITPELHYIVKGVITRQNDNHNLLIQVLKASDQQLVWSRGYELKLSAGNLLSVQNKISSDIATHLGMPYGVIQQLETQRVGFDTELPLIDYACTLHFYNYAANKSAASHLRQRKCLLDVTSNHPEHARAWSMLSWIYGDEIRFGFNKTGSVQQAKDNSLQAARKGVKLDTEDFFTHQYLAEAHALLNNREQVKKSFERALQLNPNDTDLLASVGWQLVHDDDWETGLLLANKARQLNPSHPAWYSLVPFFNHYRKGEYEQALATAAAHEDDSWQALMTRTAVLKKMGQHREAAELKRVMERDYSEVPEEQIDLLRQRHYPTAELEDIIAIFKNVSTESNNGS